MRPINNTTVSSEEHRHGHQNTQRTTNQAIHQKFGVVSEVHETLPLVRCAFITGEGVAGNNWVPLSHSVLDIVHRFGQLRPGLKVLLTFTGDGQGLVTATIIGIENEVIGIELQQKNEIDTGLYEIFTPGSSVI